MVAKTAVFHQLASIAITDLFDKGYLLDDLDWDVKAQKYTLRIRGADRRPMVAVGLITFSPKSSKIVVIDAVTAEKDEFDISKMSGTDEFLLFIRGRAEKLRQDSAYR